MISISATTDHWIAIGQALSELLHDPDALTPRERLSVQAFKYELDCAIVDERMAEKS